MNGRQRTVQIKFRVTEEERALIEQKMKLIPTDNMAAYLRKIAIDGYIIKVDHSDIKAMTAEIQKIGVNVNQIARRICIRNPPQTFRPSNGRQNINSFCKSCWNISPSKNGSSYWTRSSASEMTTRSHNTSASPSTPFASDGCGSRSTLPKF